MSKKVDEMSVRELQDFLNDKTSVYKFMYGVSMGYIADPNVDGGLALMRRVRKAWDGIIYVYTLLLEKNPKAYVPEFVQKLKWLIVGIADRPEAEQLRLLAGFTVGVFESAPDFAKMGGEYFLIHDDIAPPEIKAFLDQYLDVPFGEAKNLMGARPMIVHWENNYLSVDLPRKIYPSKMRVERPKKEQLSDETTKT